MTILSAMPGEPPTPIIKIAKRLLYKRLAISVVTPQGLEPWTQ